MMSPKWDGAEARSLCQAMGHLVDHSAVLPLIVVLQDMLNFGCCVSYRGGLFEGGMVQAR